MTKRLVLFWLICFGLVPLVAQDMSSMNAVELNTAGFRLYEAGKFEQSLAYFKASFEKDPEYGYPHYNYACVLSILKRGKGEISEHLLKSFFLEPQFREQYVSDPDLKWFRSDPDTGNPYAEYFPFRMYKTNSDLETATRELLLKGSSDERYIMEYLAGPSRLGGMTLNFSSIGAVVAQSYNAPVGGWHRIIGNVIYIELDADIELYLETGAVSSRRFIWLLEAEGYAYRIWHGCILLHDSLIPFLMKGYYEDPGWGQGV